MTPPSKPETPEVRLADRLALRPREAAAVLGISERTLRKILPGLPHVRLDGAVLIPVDLLRRWLDERAEDCRAVADAESERIEAITRDFLNSIDR